MKFDILLINDCFYSVYNFIVNLNNTIILKKMNCENYDIIFYLKPFNEIFINTNFTL